VNGRRYSEAKTQNTNFRNLFEVDESAVVNKRLRVAEDSASAGAGVRAAGLPLGVAAAGPRAAVRPPARPGCRGRVSRPSPGSERRRGWIEEGGGGNRLTEENLPGIFFNRSGTVSGRGVKQAESIW